MSQLQIDPLVYELNELRARMKVPQAFAGPPYPNLYNCTTCKFGTEPEVNKGDGMVFTSWCSWKVKWFKGPRYDDIGCNEWRYDQTKFGASKSDNRR